MIEESPADKAGVKSGDVIVSVDGRSATQFWLRDLHAIFREEGRKVRLELRRDGETFSTDLWMKRML